MGIELKEEILGSKEEHIREVEDFYCGPEQGALEDYIKGNAFRENREHKQTVYLIKDSDNNIIGYYSLKANAINYNIDNRNDVKPFIELSEFAINYRYQRKRYGTYIMLNFVFNKIKQIINIIGCQGILVFALDNTAISFYKSLGFEKVDSKEIITFQDDFSIDCTLMMISIDTIKLLDN